MTDKLFEQIKRVKRVGPVEDDVATVTSEYLNAMEDRILADADAIKAAEELAEALSAYNRGGAGPLTGWIDVEQAVSAFRQAQDRAALEGNTDDE